MRYKVGDKINTGTVVYTRGDYYVTEMTSTVYASMFSVWVGTYWRRLHIEGNGYNDALDKCVEWIAKRRCFK